MPSDSPFDDLPWDDPPKDCNVGRPKIHLQLSDVPLNPIDLLRDRRGIYGIGIRDAVDRNALAAICGHSSPDLLPRALILRPDAFADIAPREWPNAVVLQKIVGGFRHGLFSNTVEEQLRRVIHYRMLLKAGLPWPPQDSDRYWSRDEKEQRRNRQTYHGLRLGSLAVINRVIEAAIEAAANRDAIKMARRFAFKNRYPIYCAVARSARALQLAETFPVLACVIYKRDSRRVDRYDQAIRLVEHGARLRDVAAAAQIPMMLRRVKPGAAHLVPKELWARAELLACLPDSLPCMRFWLHAVSWASRNFESEFPAWIAKNAAQIPGETVDERFSFLSDLGDYVSASKGAHPFVVRPFTPTMSLRTVTKLSADWHEAVANNMDGPEHSFPEPWVPAIRINGYEIIPIASGADLYREGAAMRHCVGAYATRVMQGKCYIYSVRQGGERVATAEIVHVGGGMALAQIRGACNAQVPKEIIATMRRWLRSVTTAAKQTS